MDTEAKFVSWFRENGERRVYLNLSIHDLLAIHGNICLGLRHPDNTGTTSQIAYNVVTTIEKIFKETGMSDDVLAEIHKVEAEETTKLMEAKRKGML
jgi:hypothetical protein